MYLWMCWWASFSANLCKRALGVTAGVIVEATCNAYILTINANEDFQSNMNDHKTHSEEKQRDHVITAHSLVSALTLRQLHLWSCPYNDIYSDI